MSQTVVGVYAGDLVATVTMPEQKTTLGPVLVGGAMLANTRLPDGTERTVLWGAAHPQPPVAGCRRRPRS